MKRIAAIGLAGLALAGGAWTGAWFWLRGDVEAQLDAEAARLAEAGGEVVYGARTIGGFPFAYDVAFDDLTVRLPGGGVTLTAAEVTGHASAFDPGAVTLAWPAEMDLEARIAADLPPMRLKLRSEGLTVVTRPAAAGALSHRLTAVAFDLQQSEPSVLTRFRFQADAPVLDLMQWPDRVEGTLAAEIATLAYAYVTEGLGESSANTSFVGLDSAFATSVAGPASFADYARGTRDLTVSLRAKSVAGEGSTGTVMGQVGYRAESGAVDARIALEGGILAISSEAEAATYDIDLSKTVQALAPIRLGVDGVTGEVRLPLAVREAPEEVVWRSTLSGLTASEELWALADPGRLLPRDPVTLVIDLAGRARWLRDPAGFAATPPAPGEQFFRLPELEIRGFSLAAAGAEVTATGVLRLPDAPAAEGMPEGRIELAATGLDALAGRLAEAGLISSEQRTLFAGLSRAYARPGPTADSLTTVVEMGPEGVSVNGLLLQSAPPPAAVDAPLPPPPADAPAQAAPEVMPGPDPVAPAPAAPAAP
jgi:hypothetical protein